MLFIPDPADRYRPALLRLVLSNPGTQPTRPMDLSVDMDKFTPSWKDIGDMTGYYYKDGFKPMWVFWGAKLHIPSLKPGETLDVPIALQETYSLRTDQDNIKWSCWAWGYHRTQHLTVKTTLVNPIQGPDNVKVQQSVDFVPDAN